MSQSAAILIRLPDQIDEDRVARLRRVLEIDDYLDWEYPQVEVADDLETRVLWDAVNRNQPSKRRICLRYYGCTFMLGTCRLRSGGCGFFLEGDVMDVLEAFGLFGIANLLKAIQGKGRGGTLVYGSCEASGLVEYLAGDFDDGEFHDDIWAIAGLQQTLRKRILNVSYRFPREPEIEVQGVLFHANEHLIEGQQKCRRSMEAVRKRSILSRIKGWFRSSR
jgi:hypothetical protein